ncbi:TonB-dependent receptor [Luteimonas sp. RD2P54]|uniref:TonB-dependent receptor n=1 Tax=Luteimonas endophytica TaxID=3042023 RepID=A0ABT6JAU2_9GAMM|nr:TonB-dependent receptor [Luteimonas endophytica]MDH5823953.1 TonB-dependent receptor [Luteimonas endophytica]
MPRPSAPPSPVTAPLRQPWPLRMAVATALALAGTGAIAAEPSAADLAALPIEHLLDLEVSTASRFRQDARAAPSAVRVVTAGQIRDHGWRTLGEALTSLPGLFGSHDRNYAYLGARGFMRPGDFDSRFLVLVDGVRVNDPIYDQGSTGTDFVLDMDLVERIEYVPGPGSSVYGSSAFFGVVNVMTRDAADYPVPELRLAYGSDGHRGMALRRGWRDAHGRELLLAASAFARDGRDLYFPEFDTPADNHGIAVANDDDSAHRLLLKAGAGGFGVTLLHASRSKGIPTASYAQRFNDPRPYTRDVRSQAAIAWQGDTAGGLALSGHLSAGRFAYDGLYVYDGETGEDVLNIDRSRARWAGASFQALSTALAGHTLVVGADARWDQRLRQFNVDLDPFWSYADDSRSAHRYGLFVEDEIALGSRLLVNAGLRYDVEFEGARRFSPRLALIWHPSERDTLKAIVGEAFRTPNAYERYYGIAEGELEGGDGEGVQRANPDLGSERIRTTELAYLRTLGAYTRLQASAYRYRSRDLVTQVADPDNGQLVFENTDSVQVTGAEFGVERSWPGGATLRASWEWAHLDLDASEAAVMAAPERMAKLQLALPLFDGAMRAGLDARHLSARDGLYGPVPGHWLSNLTLRWPRLTPRTGLSASVYNLFDRRYADPAGPAFVQNAIEQDGRRFLLQLEHRF